MERKIIIPDEFLLAMAAYAGIKFTLFVEGVEMVGDYRLGQRWARAKCHQLNEEYAGLTPKEFASIVESMLEEVLGKVYWGYRFCGFSRVQQYGNGVTEISVAAECVS